MNGTYHYGRLTITLINVNEITFNYNVSLLFTEPFDSCITLYTTTLLLLPGQSAAFKQKRANELNEPWITDEIIKRIQHGQDLFEKWLKVREGTCNFGVNNFKGGTCPCPICLEKRSHHNAFKKHEKFTKKLKYRAKLEYFAGELVIYNYNDLCMYYGVFDVGMVLL